MTGENAARQGQTNSFAKKKAGHGKFVINNAFEDKLLALLWLTRRKGKTCWKSASWNELLVDAEDRKEGNHTTQRCEEGTTDITAGHAELMHTMGRG